ncbi:DUF389 domain-containing protein [Streptomyces sp. NPDC017230]|uniref:DUF389 domain-containing protein n=1 Tax=unclassified Streptomyces TaxID=2593676 RepID=UPI0037A24E0C
MLRLRLITPADRTDEVVDLIDRTVGTAHLVVLPGVAREPEGGDVVTCFVARESGDQLVNGLERLGIGRSGAITADKVELSVSERSEKAEREAPGEPADAVLWEELEEATNEESTLSITYVAFITIATMIAACGVVQDNPILIVGAMAVGPEFGPLAGISTAIVQRAPRLALRSATALLVGFAAAIVVTVVFSWIMSAFGEFSEARLEADRPNTGFVYAPDAVSFAVALLAGAAGTLSLTSAKSGTLIGVAISVTTVPAAANAAVALSFGQAGQTVGAAEQLLLNLSAIVLAGTLTLLVQKGLWATQRGRLTKPDDAG